MLGWTWTSGMSTIRYLFIWRWQKVENHVLNYSYLLEQTVIFRLVLWSTFLLLSFKFCLNFYLCYYNLVREKTAKILTAHVYFWSWCLTKYLDEYPNCGSHFHCCQRHSNIFSSLDDLLQVWIQCSGLANLLEQGLNFMQSKFLFKMVSFVFYGYIYEGAVSIYWSSKWKLRKDVNISWGSSTS